MAFYKKDEDTLLIASNFVYAPTFTLLAEDQATYTYPQDGWHWYETETIAREALGLPAVDEISTGTP